MLDRCVHKIAFLRTGDVAASRIGSRFSLTAARVEPESQSQSSGVSPEYVLAKHPSESEPGSEFRSRISAGAGVLEIVRLVHWTISRLYMVQPGVQRTKSHKGSRSEFRGPCPDRTVGHETRQSFWSLEVRSLEVWSLWVWSLQVWSLQVWSLELQSSELWILEFGISRLRVSQHGNP